MALCAFALVTACVEKPEDEKPEEELSDTRITSEQVTVGQNAYIDGIAIFNSLSSTQKTSAKAMIQANFSGAQINDTVISYSFQYPSIGPDGEKIILSGALVLPKAAADGRKAVDRLILANHFSITKNSECPSLSNNVEGALAFKNAAVVMPDYYGFGATSEFCQAYLNPDLTGRNNIDALIAAKELMAKKKIAVPEKVINFGYSQGGYNAIANLRFLSLNPQYDIRFDETYAGGGPYNVLDTFRSYISGGYGSVFPLVLVTLTSFNENEHLGIDYAEIFKESLLSRYKELILSKKYSTGEIIAALGSTAASDHLTDGMISLSSPAAAKYQAVADKYSLTSGWTPRADEKIVLAHSTFDDMVPYSNFEALSAFLQGKCELQPSVFPLEFCDHVTTYVLFLNNFVASANNWQ